MLRLYRFWLLALLIHPGLSAALGDTACQQPKGWDARCLRQAYARPPAEWPHPHVADGVVWRELGPWTSLPAHAVNTAQAALGERLFADPRLSQSNLVACISCHRPNHGFADAQAVSSGHQGRLGKRNAPTLLGAAHQRELFWDGRAATLEAQALGPLAHPDEMAIPLDQLPAKLSTLDGYPTAFVSAFGDGSISLIRIASALAAYQRTLRPPETAFDRFATGDTTALDDRALLGLHLFRTKGRCMTCHHGPLMSDGEYHNLGLTYYGGEYEDLGRHAITGKTEDVGRFRTPTLRQVGNSGPWMHNGLFRTLRGVLNMYNAGMPRPKPATPEQAADPKFPVTSPLLEPLSLDNTELEALEAFLHAL